MAAREGGELMAYRKNKVVCPYCNAEKRGMSPFSGDGLSISMLTAREYPISNATVTCDQCGKKFEVRAEKCVYYTTRAVS